MKAKNVKKTGWFLGALLAIFIFVSVCAISWAITCGLIKLITLCFGLQFSWTWATGIWLLVWLLRMCFSNGSKKS